MLAPDIAIATFLGEYFNDFGEQLKAKSPVNNTFLIRHHNGSIAYVPTEVVFKSGGYGAQLGLNVVPVSSTTGQQHVDAAITQIRTFKHTKRVTIK